MKKRLKMIGIGIGGIISILLIAILILSVLGNARLNKTTEIEAESIPIPTDETTLARGQHMVNIYCSSCHGIDLTGRPMVDDPTLGIIEAANITGAGETHTTEELIMAIRHGVDPNGRQLIAMPSDSHIYLSAADMGAIISYLQTIPATGSPRQTQQIRFTGRMVIGAGMVEPLFPASYTPHDLPYPDMPEIGANLAYGEYIARTCQGCHGDDLTGGTTPDPAAPPAPDLTQINESNGWDAPAFIAAIRTGTTPSGQVLLPQFMPWEAYSKFSDEELTALWLYLNSLE